MKPDASGPDPLKILPMLMPNMDPSAKRMCSIILKFRELMELMEPPSESPPTNSENASSQNSSAPAPDLDLANRLQEGLTPEQQSMITSLTSMLKS